MLYLILAPAFASMGDRAISIIISSDKLYGFVKMELAENVLCIMNNNNSIKDERHIALFKFLCSLRESGIFKNICWQLNLESIIDQIICLQEAGYGFMVELEEIDELVTREIEIGEEVDESWIGYIGSGGPSCGGGMPRKIYETREEIVKRQKITIKADNRLSMGKL